MLRLLSLTVLAVLAATGAVQAQVAAPMLAPLPITAAVSHGPILGTPATQISNPAAMQWNDYSFVGAALADGDQTAESAGAPFPPEEGDYEISYLQGRVMWDYFSIGLQFADGERTFGTPATVIDISQRNLALAFRIGDSLAFGLGQEITKLDDLELTINLAGVSLRLAEVFFFGVAAGQESQPIGFRYGRNVTRFGIGLRTGRDTLQWHLEAFTEERDPVDDVFIAVGTSFIGTETNGLVAELNWGGFLLGLRKISHTFSGSFMGTTLFNWESDETVITVGWVPEAGFSVVGSLLSVDSNNNGTPTGKRKRDVFSLSVGYVF